MRICDILCVSDSLLAASVTSELSDRDMAELASKPHSQLALSTNELDHPAMEYDTRY